MIRLKSRGKERQMNRDSLLSRLDSGEVWDFLVIGGGATGLGVALEASSRGYRTLLVEQSDFCKGTSSKSTKLIHGGVRYLRQGNITLVVEALRERAILLRNAPHIVHPLSLVIPTYSRWQTACYTAGLSFYDLLAGKQRVGRSRMLSEEQIRKMLPTLEDKSLRGGVLFQDAQFDDARLALSLARTCLSHGGTLVNYMKVISLLKSDSTISGAVTEDVFTGTRWRILARVVVNCAGVLSDRVRALDTPGDAMVSASRGSHVVLDRSFLGGSDCALLIPRTTDGRLLFAIPWQNRLLAGTTDVPVEKIELETQPTAEEVDFILSHLGRYLSNKPQISDILSVFAGIRPLVRSGKSKSTKSISRDHLVTASPSGLISVMGGKWTTYRKMAEEAVDRAVNASHLKPARKSVTEELRLFDWEEVDVKGDNESSLSSLMARRPLLAGQIHPAAPYRLAEVVRAVREEWACTLEDVLARRTRLLILDARASMEAAPKVAELMAEELNRDRSWQDEQVSGFRKVAVGYLPQ